MSAASSPTYSAIGPPAANLGALLKYKIGVLATLITVYAVVFHIIKFRVEGEQHSWITGFYWTLVVMTTLGFGDITFTSDIGRLFSIVVLVSGVVFLLVMLPFLFIRLFYAPWLEARVRLRAPREVRPGTRGTSSSPNTTRWPSASSDGCEPRPSRTSLSNRILRRRCGWLTTVSAMVGENDGSATYERLRAPPHACCCQLRGHGQHQHHADRARGGAGSADCAVAEEDDSVDILTLSGATTVLPLKRQLGESLANRVESGRPEAHVIGSFRSVQIAELPVRDTALAGVRVRDTHLRERTGLSVVGLWNRGKLQPAFPETEIRPESVVVVAGTASQIAAFNSLLSSGSTTAPAPVLVIGAGRVGQAAARAKKRKGLVVYVLERDGRALETIATRRGRCPCGRCRRSECDRAGRHPPRRLGASHDQRGCDEHLPGGVLPAAQSGVADREPHYARAQR